MIHIVKLNVNIKIDEFEIKDKVVFWKWASSTVLAIIAESKVYHYKLDVNNLSSDRLHIFF